MRIIAAPRDENDILDEERARLAIWAPTNDWTYLEYADAFELLSQLSAMQAEKLLPIAELEIVAHGNPAVCNGVSLDNAAVVGASLRRIHGVGNETALYLSGCNTGLELNGESLARTIAAAFNGPVFGARGYLAGTHAENSEQCVASFTFEGIVYHSYPGGTDAAGPSVWRRFGPGSGSGGGENMQIKIATSGFRPVNIQGGEVQELLNAVEGIVRTPGAPSPRWRMAPDLTFVIRLADGEHVFELLAGGTVLRDPVTRTVWQFEQGRALLTNLLPYRKLPAA